MDSQSVNMNGIVKVHENTLLNLKNHKTLQMYKCIASTKQTVIIIDRADFGQTYLEPLIFDRN